MERATVSVVGLCLILATIAIHNVAQTWVAWLLWILVLGVGGV
jgi:hypothetical protein